MKVVNKFSPDMVNSMIRSIEREREIRREIPIATGETLPIFSTGDGGWYLTLAQISFQGTAADWTTYQLEPEDLGTLATIFTRAVMDLVGGEIRVRR